MWERNEEEKLSGIREKESVVRAEDVENTGVRQEIVRMWWDFMEKNSMEVTNCQSSF